MEKLENMMENPSKETIISFLKELITDYNKVLDKEKYLEELKDLSFFIISNVEEIQRKELGEKVNSFMIVLEDYWLLIFWYVILACHEPFVNNIDKIIKMCEKEWIAEECFNIKDKDRNELINLSEEKFNLMSILENSKSSFYYFNIPYQNKYTECHTKSIPNMIHIFELFGVNNENFPIQMSFSYFLGQSLYFYILEKKTKLIEEYKKEFDISDNDCPEKFADNFALALLQFTEYDIEEIDLKQKEKYTRYFEELTSKLIETKKISKNQFCPCGSGKKYKDCCEKKELKWMSQNSKITKLLPINNVVSYSIKDLSRRFTKILGRKPYGYESLFKMLGMIEGSYEKLFSQMTDLNLPLDRQYATLKTGMFLTEFNYEQFPDSDLDEWDEAIEKFKTKNLIKEYNGKSIFEAVKEANQKLKKVDDKINNVVMIMNIYLNFFLVNYKNLNVIIENQKDFSVVCARKIIIDAKILISAFNHKSIEEVTNITRIIFEDLIQTAVLLKEKVLFEEKIIPLTLFEKGILEYKMNTEGKLSKNILINPKTGKEYKVKINIKDLSLKNKNYQNFYDNIFDSMSSFIHLSVNKVPKYFNIPNPLTEVQEFKTTSLLGLFLLNQCIYEIKSNLQLDCLLLRDMEYIYSKNVTYINKCLKMLLILEPDNEIYNEMLKLQKKCMKTIKPNNKIKLCN